MTTMTEKLLARAAEYEDKARSLRLAAAEMNGHAVTSKQASAGSTLQQAIALRKGQRQTANGHHRNNQPLSTATRPEREATIRAFLAEGPQGSAAIHEQLVARGQQCSSSHLGKVLNEMRDVQRHGFGRMSVWGLGKGKGKPAATAKPKRSLTRANVRETRTRVAEVLAHYDRETPKAPGEVAKALGLTVSQSGLAPLVHQGYLKKRGAKGYVRTAKPYVIEQTPAATGA